MSSTEEVSTTRLVDAASDGPGAAAGGDAVTVRTTRRERTRLVTRILIWSAVLGLIVFSQLSHLREASVEVQAISAGRLLIGFVLVMASIACYSGVTRVALIDRSDEIGHPLMFRIQLSTRALANVVPGGNATASALGFRLLTQSGVSGAGAGFALATAGICSAVVLNLLFWSALAIALPTRGIDRTFLIAAGVGLVLLVVIAVIAFAATRASGRLSQLARRLASRMSIDPSRLSTLRAEAAARWAALRGDGALLRRLAMWSGAQWATDMAALWVFLSAFDIRLDPLLLVLVFGAANIAAALPITPGGLGVVEGVYIASLVQVGYTFQEATLGIAAYRLAHYVFPIAAGGVSYVSLRTGRWRLAAARDQATRDQ